MVNVEPNLFGLLDYSEKHVLIDIKSKLKIINIAIFQLQEIHDSLLAFSKHQYYKFDAQVGENLCQIRALQVLDMATHKAQFMLDNSTVSIVCRKLQRVILYGTLAKNKYYSLMISQGNIKNHQVLRDFLKNENFLLTIPQSYLYLAMLHFLARFCLLDEFGIPTQIDLKRIQKVIGISKNSAKRLVHLFQSNVALASTQYVLDLHASQHGSDITEQFRKLLYLSDENRAVLPYYESMNVLLRYVKSLQLPFVLIIKTPDEIPRDHITLLFICDSKGIYSPASHTSTSLDRPAIIIEGVSSILGSNGKSASSDVFKQRVISVGIEKLIQLNMAAHPQYTGLVLDELKQNPYLWCLQNEPNNPYFHRLKRELENAQYNASVLGCERERPELLLVKHIFCDMIKNQLSVNDRFPNEEEQILRDKFCVST